MYLYYIGLDFCNDQINIIKCQVKYNHNISYMASVISLNFVNVLFEYSDIIIHITHTFYVL